MTTNYLCYIMAIMQSKINTPKTRLNNLTSYAIVFNKMRQGLIHCAMVSK